MPPTPWLLLSTIPVTFCFSQGCVVSSLHLHMGPFPPVGPSASHLTHCLLSRPGFCMSSRPLLRFHFTQGAFLRSTRTGQGASPGAPQHLHRALSTTGCLGFNCTCLCHFSNLGPPLLEGTGLCLGQCALKFAQCLPMPAKIDPYLLSE